MPPLSFMTRGASMRPDTEDENDPGALVEQLLSRLESTPIPAPPQTRPSHRIIGSIGDALLAMATVRAGGAPPAMGPFAASQARIAQEYREAKRSAEEQNIENRNRVRIGAFEEELRAKRESEIASIRNESQVQRLEIAAQNARTAEERARLQAEANDIRMRLGSESLDLRRQLGEQSLKIKELEFGLKTTNRPIPDSIAKDIGEISASLEAAQSALTQYKSLGRPDLGLIFTKLTPERFADPKKIKARRILSEAIVPIRNFFLGAAVTDSEKASAAPLIANLEGGVPPNVLEESLIGLVNLAERSRRSRLQAAELGGFDVSRFQQTTPGQQTPAGAPQTVTTPAGKTIRYRMNERGEIVVED